MADSKPSDLKICVTCQYWGGRRKASTFRESVEYGSDLNKSECVGGERDGQQPTGRAHRHSDSYGDCVGGGWNGQQQAAWSGCDKWEKWGVLN